jgi:hypothetical protein
MLSVTYNPFMLNVIMLSVIMLSVIMLSVIMLNVVMLNVVILNVLAPDSELCSHNLPSLLCQPGVLYKDPTV